ncbi:DHH family phosphoesterase [Mesomycoplasma conjunctivae]|uniref:DHH family phosphoesterase n=1 Tax=Mesomycoplasma conjunctivae TaxID=45361 RepID=UPI003DA32B6B
MQANNTGIITLSSTYQITSYSEYISDIYKEKLIGKTIFQLFPQYKKIESIPNEFKIKKGHKSYLIIFDRFNYWISIRDITLFESLLTGYKNNSLVVAEIEIDNLNSSTFKNSNQDISNIKIFVNTFLENLSKKHHFLYKEYENGKFFLVLRYETFLLWQKSHFGVFGEDKTRIDDNSTVWLSVGFGLGSDNLIELRSLAQDAISFSKIRGGNQVSIYEHGKKLFSYGSYSENVIDSSLVALKNISRLLLDKLENAKNIIIYGHLNSDLDALGAAFGLGTFLKQYASEVYKKNINFYIQNKTFDSTASRFLAQSDFVTKDYFISPQFASKISAKGAKNESVIAILVDVSSIARIENKKAFNNISPQNIFIFDHHLVNADAQQTLEYINDYIDTSASSTCEIITNLILLTYNYQIKIDQQVAQILLNGIYVDSAQFKKTTSISTFNAVSALVRWGAKIAQTTEFLKLNEAESNIINNILAKVVEVKPGFFLAVDNQEIDVDLVSIACEQILSVKGRKAAFVVAKVPNKKYYKMSARSLSDVNVQYIAEQLGGGGNFSSSAAISTTETFEEFVENIELAIKRRDYESYTN